MDDHMRAGVRRGPDPVGDQGYSLIELVVAMGIMSIVMIVMTGAMLQMYSATNQTEGTAFAGDQIGNAFRRLGKELRYATWVAVPGQSSNQWWYMEYAVAGGCRQLVLRDDGVLTVASWTAPARTPGAPSVIASELDVLAGTQPFTLYKPTDEPYATASPGTAGVGKLYAPMYSQVRVQLTATVGKVTLPFDTVFTAQNTPNPYQATNDCSWGRPTP